MGEYLSVSSKFAVKCTHERVDELARNDPTARLHIVGSTRSNEQNKLAFEIYNRAHKHRGKENIDFEELRAECKLYCGVPILRRDDEDFRESYDRVFKHMPYEDKVKYFVAFQMPITSLMNPKQMTEFISNLFKKFNDEGVHLADLDNDGYMA